MLNFGKYAAIAAAGLGLAALAAPSAEACGFVRVYSCGPVGHVSMGGWGRSYGMYRPAMTYRSVLAYHPVTTYRPILAYHPVTTYRPVLAYHPVTTYRPAYGYARPSYGAAYGYAAPVVHRIYRPVAYRVYKPATYAWVAPRVHRVYRTFTYGAAYGYVPRFRPIHAFGCVC